MHIRQHEYANEKIISVKSLFTLQMDYLPTYTFIYEHLVTSEFHPKAQNKGMVLLHV